MSKVVVGADGTRNPVPYCGRYEGNSSRGMCVVSVKQTMDNKPKVIKCGTLFEQQFSDGSALIYKVTHKDGYDKYICTVVGCSPVGPVKCTKSVSGETLRGFFQM